MGPRPPVFLCFGRNKFSVQKNKLCICIAGKCPPHLCDISGSTSALASVGASVIVGKKPKNGFFYLTRFGWVAAVMADFRTRAVKGKGFSPRGGSS